MRDSIGWSYELLDPTEQTVFRQLSICVGGCTLAAAEAVVGSDLFASSDEFLDVVAVLVDHSLIRVGEDSSAEPRLNMLEVVREYGLERLAEDDKATEPHQRHADYFVGLAEQAAAQLMSPAQGKWLERLEREHGNLRETLQWAVESRADELGLHLVNALGPFWFFRGYFREGRSWIERFLTSSADRADLGARRLSVFYGAAKLALEQGDYARVSAVAVEMQALALALGDALGMAQALEMQGNMARIRGDLLGGRALLEDAVLWSRRAGDSLQLGRVLFALGHSAREVGDLSRAELAFEEQLADARRYGLAHAEGRVLVGLGLVARDRGDYEQAKECYSEALTVFTKIRELAGFAYCFEGLGALARRRTDMARTVTLCAVAARLRELVASTLTPAERLAFEEEVAEARASLGEAAFAAAWSAGQRLELDEALVYAAE
jgi:tetratricopeptide (TPR) repeat protein